MKKFLAAGVSLVAFSLPGVAIAATPTKNHWRTYNHLYTQARHKFGSKAVGCRLGKTCHHRTTDAALVASSAVLLRLLHPAAAPATSAAQAQPVTSTYTPSQTYAPALPATTASTGGYGGGLPSCASESGTNYSTGPANTNASSGATGRYQITPGTAANYGCNLSTPGGQDQCAQQIYAHQGAGAWVGCGG